MTRGTLKWKLKIALGIKKIAKDDWNEKHEYLAAFVVTLTHRIIHLFNIIKY